MLVFGFEERSIDTDAAAQGAENDLGFRRVKEQWRVEQSVAETE
jgi:hypothetical protein